MQYVFRRSVHVSLIYLPIIIYPRAVELAVTDFICESVQYGKSKTNVVQFDRGHVVTIKHIVQYTTFQIIKENYERCLVKCFF